MLADLVAASADLLGCLAKIDEAVAAERMPADFLNLRWRFGRLNAARASLLKNDVLPQLRRRTTPEAVAASLMLQDEAALAYERLSAHIGRWSGAAIEVDWNHYRRDARALIGNLRQQIEAEEEWLHPLLAAEMPARVARSWLSGPA